jgi:RNA polymerase sigma-70 factor (ECF subfamily)
MAGTHKRMVKRDDLAAQNRPFATTHWSLVQAAGRQGSADAQRALAQLCETYWYPVYAFVRRQGGDAALAQDLTQAFFCRLLEKNDLAAADRQRGRFRAFLLTAVKHFLSNERDRAMAKKRGGGQRPLSLDFDAAEGRYRREPSHDLTPERLFERRWALEVLDRTLARLRTEHIEAGKERLFEGLKGTLAGEPTAAPLAEIAALLGTTEGALKTAAHRLRRRYRDLIRQEIAHTVARVDDVDDEIKALFAAVK